MNDWPHRWWIVVGILAVWAPLRFLAPDSTLLFFPLMLLAIQIGTVLLGPAQGLSLAAGVVGLEGWAMVVGRITGAELLARAGFVGVFAATFAGVLRVEVLRLRNRHHRALADRLQRWREEARDFRLIGSLLPRPSTPIRNDEEREQLRNIGSVEALRAWIRAQLLLTRRAMAADDVRLFTLNLTGDRLRAHPSVHDIDRDSDVQLSPAGAIGAVLKTGRSVQLRLREEGARLGYASRGPVGQCLAVPIRHENRLQGVLTAERTAPEVFTPEQEDLLSAAAASLGHAVDAERLFAEMDRAQREQDHFLLAMRLLARALGPTEVAQRLVEAALPLVEWEILAVTRFTGGRHQVAALSPEAGPGIHVGDELPDDGLNLVSQALRTRVALPFVPLCDQPDVDGSRVLSPLPVIPTSLKVFPVVHRDEPLGCLVVGSRRVARRLDREVERTLEAVAVQAGVSWTNARMFEQVERMATTDGLTGLVNHRRFQEILEGSIERARRLNHPVSVVFVDADHFKTVNDTFGHPVGDVVLQQLADVLSSQARKTDVVARYGGEEFVLLLEGTDTGGALEVAERTRLQIEATKIRGDFGTLCITASLGVCSFPSAASDRKELLARADRALYQAKSRGRNQVRVYSGTHCPGPKESATDEDDADARHSQVLV